MEDLNAKGRIILKQILKQTEWFGLDRICLGLDRDGTSCCGHDDEHSGYVKLQELLFHKNDLGLGQSVSQELGQLNSFIRHLEATNYRLPWIVGK